MQKHLITVAIVIVALVAYFQFVAPIIAKKS